MHEAEQTYETATVHTPLVIYAPELFKHKSFDYPVGEPDIMATIAGLTGETYVNTAIGRDLLDKDFDSKKHYAFYLTHEEDFKINLIGKEFIYRMRASGKDKRLLKYYYDKKDEDVSEQYPEIAKEMEGVCKGIFESTRYIRFHNDPQTVEKRLKEI
jgi:phosphoglycerol transferase MdoB-like AlkP superfamily enzyme